MFVSPEGSVRALTWWKSSDVREKEAADKTKIKEYVSRVEQDAVMRM